MPVVVLLVVVLVVLLLVVLLLLLLLITELYQGANTELKKRVVTYGILAKQGHMRKNW